MPATIAVAAGAPVACGSSSDHAASGPSASGASTSSGSTAASSGSRAGASTSSAPSMTPVGDGGNTAPGPNGNPDGHCAVPAEAQAEDVSNPTTAVGDGTSASCTADAVVAAVHTGGVVTFACGADPVTIVVPEIMIYNDGGATHDGSVTIDGGGKVTLSGGGDHRILHQDTCDSSLHYTSPYCNNQDTPRLVLQNIGFTAGAGAAAEKGLLGGGAVYVGGGRFKAVNVRVTASTQTNDANVNVQDLAGGAIYTIDMYDAATANAMFTTPATPTYVVGSTFQGNSGINGGALGSIGTSWTILNSLFSGNSATGHGENPAASGTEGGGLGGAIYNDGDGYTLSVCGTLFAQNTANELGTGSIFQVVDDLKGALVVDQSTFQGNSDNGDVQTAAKHPSIYVQAKSSTDGTSGVTITATTFD